MKHKLILFLFALTTCLSLLNGLTSAPDSAGNKLDLWVRQAETGPTMAAWCPDCGQSSESGSTSTSGGATTNGNSRGGG